MNFCRYCGKKIQVKGKFCAYCGEIIGEVLFETEDPNEISSGKVISYFKPTLYLGGIPGLIKVWRVTLILNENSLVVRRFGNEKAVIDLRRITEVTPFADEKSTTRIKLVKAEKNRSVLGRGLAGGLLFGPLGMILGGLSGVPNKKTTKFGKSTTHSIEWFINITYLGQSGIQNKALFQYLAPFWKEKNTRKFANQIISQIE